MQNNCKTIRPQLSEFVDGTIRSDSSWKIQLHLSTCKECARTVQSIEKTVSILRATSKPVLSSSFDAALAARVAQVREQRERSMRSSWFSRTWFSAQAVISANRFMIGHSLRLSAPIAAAACVLGLLIVGQSSVPVATTPKAVELSSADFAKACQHDHQSYLAGQPFADPSAQALMQRQTDDAMAKEGAALLSSGNI